MEKEKMMPFGKKVSVGNFYVVKVTRSLSAAEQKVLRAGRNVPQDVRKRLTRRGLPYIVVNSVSGGWSISYVAGSLMYNFIEHEYLSGEEGLQSLSSLFIMLFADTSILGDAEYLKAKGDALRAFVERNKAAAGDVDDSEILEDMKRDEQAIAVIKEMADEIAKEEKEEAHGKEEEAEEGSEKAEESGQA